MGTIATLDFSRPEMTELPWGHHRKASEIETASGYRNTLKLWPHTQTMTLQPINTTTDFRGSGQWEALKFRLADVEYDKDWWDERPNYTAQDDGSKCDYFFRLKVKNSNVPPQYVNGGGSGLSLLQLLKPLALDEILLAISLEEQNSVGAMRSQADYPSNQGYMLRFWLEGRPEFGDADLLTFYFGDYAVRLSGSGMAYLFQALDDTLQTYAPSTPLPGVLTAKCITAITNFSSIRTRAIKSNSWFPMRLIQARVWYNRRDSREHLLTAAASMKCLESLSLTVSAALSSRSQAPGDCESRSGFARISRFLGLALIPA